MAKSKTSSYVLTLKLQTNDRDIAILNKRFEICRKLYNSILGIATKRLDTLTERKCYRQLRKELAEVNKQYHNCKDKKKVKGIEKDRKAKYKELQTMLQEFSLSEFSLINDMTSLYKKFNKNIDNKTAQALAKTAWKSIEKLIYGEAKKVNFKGYNNGLKSVEGLWNASGITYRDGIIKWNKLNIPVIIKQNDTYAQKAIQDKIKYCRIVKKEINGKDRFYIQLVLEGIPPMKINKDGEIKNSVGVGNVGIDIGTRTIAISSQYDVKLLELAPRVQNIERELKLIQRKMDRSKRATSPNKYNDNGTIKKGNRDKWIFSNKYLKLSLIRKELYRKQSVYRKQDHETMANYIIGLGDRIFVETMNFKGLQKKAKNTTVNKNGKINKKKRFGKSLANKAPAMLIEIINRKLKYDNLTINKINTQKVKASQYNHFNDEYNKKQLKDRWNNDIEIQRDMYSAFLIMNVNNDLESINRELCFETYDNFKILHDKEIFRLKELKKNGVKFISSMGI